MYISEVDDWLEKCATDPRWLAESMQRIGRFGGQHPTANVLNHSLEVAYMLRGSTPDVQLWALLHDAHEVLTGDVPRQYKRTQILSEQQLLDCALQRRLGIDITHNSVEVMDKLCGDMEAKHWGGVIFHCRIGCVDIFETKFNSLKAKLV